MHLINRRQGSNQVFQMFSDCRNEDLVKSSIENQRFGTRSKDALVYLLICCISKILAPSNSQNTIPSVSEKVNNFGQGGLGETRAQFI